MRTHILCMTSSARGWAYLQYHSSRYKNYFKKNTNMAFSRNESIAAAIKREQTLTLLLFFLQVHQFLKTHQKYSHCIRLSVYCNRSKNHSFKHKECVRMVHCTGYLAWCLGWSPIFYEQNRREKHRRNLIKDRRAHAHQEINAPTI